MCPEASSQPSWWIESREDHTLSLLPLDSNYYSLPQMSGFWEECSGVTISVPSKFLHYYLLVQHHLLPMRQKAAHIHLNTPWISFNSYHF